MKPVETLEYSDENIKELEDLGYTKSAVSKPYSLNKVIRYSPTRGVYWFSSSRAAHMSDCHYTRQKVVQLIII